MTSPADQISVPATNTSANTAFSYASAAGAPKKPAQAPVVASSPAQNANAAPSDNIVNGKPAVPRGSSANGSAPEHARKTSVTMAANGPNSFVANGAPAAGAKSGIQFGFDSSPAIAHSTPQTGSSAPMPIPGGNARVPSPALSPSPIPQPSASGGRPPSSLQQPSGQMTFGSLNSEGDRNMRNPSNQSHLRRESTHSAQGETPGSAGRGFNPQGGRGRGFNPNYNNQMGYPPNGQFRHGPGQGRGMPPFQQPPRNMPYPNSPQPNRVSPAMAPSMPGTPNMAPANMPPNMPMQTPQYHYPPPMAPHQGQVQHPFPPPSRVTKYQRKSNRGRSEYDQPPFVYSREDPGREAASQDLSHPGPIPSGAEQHERGQNVVVVRSTKSCRRASAPLKSKTASLKSPYDLKGFDLSPESGNFENWLTLKNQNFGFPPQQMDQYGRPMSVQYGGYGNMPYMGPQANNPGYNAQFGPPQFHPQGHSMSRTPSQPERPPSTGQQNAPVIVSSNAQQPNAALKPSSAFVKPRKSAAIQIKNAAGEVVDTSAFKAPASPASSVHQAKTPPAVASSPTPPPKATMPAHARTESQATSKTPKEIQDELKAKIMQATQTPTDDKPAEKSPAAAEAAEEAKPPVETEEPKAAPEESKTVPEEPKAAPEEPKAAPAKTDEPAAPVEPEEDELERQIREMEEADAAREKAEEEHQKKRDAEKAAAKEKDAANAPTSAADADRKLREQEREMERLEEEKEKSRAAAGGSAPSVADLLAGRAAPAAETKVEDVADKLADMKIVAKDPIPKPSTAEKRGPKPAALNLAPLNTKSVEPPQPSAALQSLKSARFLQVMDQDLYPNGIQSPNPALNSAVAKKGKTFKYDNGFLLQFQKVYTEQPSLEFHQQVKSLIGEDGGKSASGKNQTPRQASRGAGAPQFGNFAAPRAPPGSTSEERFALSNNSPATMRPPNPMASFGRPGGAFPASASLSRTGSQANMSMPNARQSNRSGRGSRRDVSAKEVQSSKNMPLTAGMELKPIAVTSTGWKPTSLGRGGAGASAVAGYMDPAMVQRKVKAALNKMTPEKFMKISDEILVIASQSKDETDGRTVRQVIQLTFEKATDEAHWASMYAKFCKRMLDQMSPDIRDEHIKDKGGNLVSGGNLFRKYLLNRCQEEFERGWQSELPKLTEGEKDPKTGEAVMLSDAYYIAAAAKRRGLGLVQFIGELYKLGMLTERIMHECVHKLVDFKGIPDEAEIESLSKLLRTIGSNLDATEKGRPMMNAYFARIEQMIAIPELPSRMQFMLLDVVDLRRSNWHSKEANKGPKTLDEVRLEAEAAQAAKAQENARSHQRGGPGGGRPQAGRGDARNFSAGYQQTSNQVGMDDLRRLKGSTARAASQNISLGPSSMFGSRTNSGRRLGPGGTLSRGGEESGASSRTGTPPVGAPSRANAFEALANMDNEDPTSPPSTAASPALSKAVPASKKEGE